MRCDLARKHFEEIPLGELIETMVGTNVNLQAEPVVCSYEHPDGHGRLYVFGAAVDPLALFIMLASRVPTLQPQYHQANLGAPLLNCVLNTHGPVDVNNDHSDEVLILAPPNGGLGCAVYINASLAISIDKNLKEDSDGLILDAATGLWKLTAPLGDPDAKPPSRLEQLCEIMRHFRLLSEWRFELSNKQRFSCVNGELNQWRRQGDVTWASINNRALVEMMAASKSIHLRRPDAL